jgi:hypothetical protein
MNPFDITRITRNNVLGLIDELSTSQLNAIPTGFKNNIIWQVGHLLATQQLLTYGLSGKDFLLSDNIIEEFRKGTKPEKDYSEDDIEELKFVFIEVINQTEIDYKEGVFKTFNTYPTSFGATLNSIDDAVIFNNVHEGLHMGLIMAMKKLV